MALMDFDGTLESADPNVEILLMSTTWLKENRDLALAWPLFKHEKKHWDTRQSKYEYTISNRNSEFTCAPLKVDLHKMNRISLNINVL